MKVQPTTDKPQPTFGNKIYKHTKQTPYGKCIHGMSAKGLNYDVYVDENQKSKNILYKLYYITKNNKWVKSILRFYTNNKIYKEIRSKAK